MSLASWGSGRHARTTPSKALVPLAVVSIADDNLRPTQGGHLMLGSTVVHPAGSWRATHDIEDADLGLHPEAKTADCRSGGLAVTVTVHREIV